MKLHYKKYGFGPPIVILHGLFGMGDNWRTVTKMLEKQNQCILPDLRNHGRSPHDPVMNFEVMTADIKELIEDLHLTKSIMLGHSMGGKVAMDFAMKYPEWIEKLIVVDIAPKVYSPAHDEVIQAIESIDPGRMKDRNDVENSFARFLGKDQATIQFLMKNLARLPEGGFAWKSNMTGIINAYEQLSVDIKITQTFGKPTLFVRGENSNYILDDDWPRILEIFPSAHLITIPNAGHWVHADAPDAFANEVLGFLNK